ncbi:MAG: tetratricopeptide repeat protein, partial [Planctomycetota bacterium]
MNPIFRTLLPLTAATAVLAATCGLGGCAPRSTGMEARKEANARFNQTTSLVSYDQAKQAFESGQLDLAQEEVEKALLRSGKEAKYWVLLGRIELESKRLELAVSAFGRAIECDPNLAETYYFRAIVYQRWSERDKAIADYRKASELAPDKVNYLLATAELMVAARQLDDARTLLLSKLAYFEHNPALHELLGDIASLSGDPATAARSFERALVIDPDAPMLAEKTMEAYFKAAEWQRCLDSARR